MKPDREPARPRLVVGIGSAGNGLNAFKQLLPVLPADSGMVFMLMPQHSPPDKRSWIELLSSSTRMTVIEASPRVVLQPNTVYVIPQDMAALSVRHDRIEAGTPAPHPDVRLPADHLFRSLACDYGPRAVGIILSYADSCDSVGLRDITTAGGLTIALNSDSDSQPGTAQSSDALVLQIDQISAALEHFASLSSQASGEPPAADRNQEELHLLNEELSVVNARLREKVEQLEQAHDDLHNFFASTKIATIFLDERLCIKRFTPAARELLGIEPADQGRSIAGLVHELLQNGLAGEAKKVLECFSTHSRELHTREGRWITRRALPYRTESGRVEGVVVTFTEVTELRSAKESLEEKNRRLELAWEAARGGIFEYCMPMDESTFHSDQWAQILGYRRNELPPFDRFLPWLQERIHPEDRERFEQAYNKFIGGRADHHDGEIRLRHRRGHWVWVRSISKALKRNVDGTVRHVLGMMIDITDLKQAEEALRESESRFREMADGLPLIVWVHDASGQQEYVNETFCEFFGVRREEMKGGRWQVLMHPEDAENYNREFYACVRDKRPFHAETRVKHADGTWRWIESWGRPRWTDAGEFRGFIGTSADITERRRIETVLRDSEARFRTMADNIAQLAWMARSDGWIFWYNKRWYDYTGTTFDEMEGWGWRSVHHPEHLDRVVKKIRHSFQADEVWEDTFPLRSANGQYRWFLSRAVPIRDKDGVVVRWFGTNTDITEQRDAEQKLVQAGRQKDEFLAMLGHELRNPLAAIRSASEIIKLRCSDDPKLQQTQAILERQTIHMSKLLDGLLDISRIIRGKINLELEEVNFASVCREVIEVLASRTPKRNLNVQTDIPPEPVWIEADPVRLSQIVDNLLSNAVKYTPDGGTVQVTLVTENGMAKLCVRDTGMGIEPELLPHIFDIFRQSEQSIDRADGGLGLGLALVKSLTELHGGSIEVKSAGKNQGAEFVVRLPVTKKTASQTSDAKSAVKNAARVLLIEDNEDAAESLRQLIELAFGHQVAVAADGRQGIVMAKEFEPDVILCDLGLPGDMDGFDVASTLRANAHSQHIRLVAVSGYGRPEDKARSTEAGFDEHITKPVDIKALEQTITKTHAVGKD